MKKSVCPITKKPMVCSTCKVVINGKCPYMEFDSVIEYTLQFLRRVVENEQR